ncbi:hypothetical protein Leryth_023230 [Lithospermum erythrorhizon]|uniref:Queuine tRNA-ribosyltransferase accessory subunit 2 n=1 Tax=Lithospermum erythrorhizon TaxID=34254 RepID=A0AAV3Q2Q2_LITER|nr:hypothetical protein Leryth_023230 [Lithospermum erythrorhizon]
MIALKPPRLAAPEKKMLSIKSWSKGRARAGVLHLPGFPHPIETPALLITTRKGLPYFTPPDHLHSLPSPDSTLLQFSPLHFWEVISLSAISNVGGLHKLVSLQDHIFAAVPRDDVASVPEYQSTNKIGASFETPCGRCLLKPTEYMEMISAMKPNIWATLADEVPAWVSEKRNKASIERTIRWLDDCVGTRSADTTGGAVFGSVVGGSRIEGRQLCAQEVAKRSVSGYWIGGFGLGETVEERSALLNAVTDNLPKEKPRHISGLGLPEEVLQGVAAGVDLFDSMYIYHLTLGGFALIFPLDGTRHDADHLISDCNSDGTKINLKAISYRKDKSPIVACCKCFTCQHHTKGYINHLFNVHEMLAQTLLEIHNTHHFLGFFRSIREAINAGKFEEFRQNFVERRRDNLMATALCA